MVERIDIGPPSKEASSRSEPLSPSDEKLLSELEEITKASRDDETKPEHK